MTSGSLPRTRTRYSKLRYFDMSEQVKHVDDIRAILETSRTGIDAPQIERWAQEAGVGELWQQLWRARS